MANLDDAIRCAKLAKDAYLDESAFVEKHGDCTFIDNPQTCTQGFVVHQPEDKALYCVFRGTSSPWDLPTDLNGLQHPLAGAGKVHAGFFGAFRSIEADLPMPIDANGATQSWRVTNGTFVESFIDFDVARVFITGHSLGGALASFAFCKLSRYSAAVAKARSAGPIEIQLYTFGAPPVGDSVFANYLNRIVSDAPRFRSACRVHAPKDPIATLDALHPGVVHAGDSLSVQAEQHGPTRPFHHHSIATYIEALEA